MELPKLIKVAGFDIKIVEWERLAASAAHRFGEWSDVESIIRIDTSVEKSNVIDTVLHELNHVIFWAYNLEEKDSEERICATLATAYLQVWRDNPKLYDWIAISISELNKTRG